MGCVRLFICSCGCYGPLSQCFCHDDPLVGCLFQAWLSSHTQTSAALLKQLFDVNTEMAFRFIESCCSPVISVEKVQQVVVCLKLLQVGLIRFSDFACMKTTENVLEMDGIIALLNQSFWHGIA